jgi:hypothetical protein
MKQMTCPAMGGPATCTATLSGNTPEEMVADGMKHVEANHPEMAAQIKAMSKEDMAKWMADFKPKFDALPELSAA